MSWTDEEIDKLYQETTSGLKFEYKNEYWKEMEAMLPPAGKGRGDALWFITALMFLGLIGSVAVKNHFYNESPVQEQELTATTQASSHTNHIDSQKQTSEKINPVQQISTKSVVPSGSRPDPKSKNQIGPTGNRYKVKSTPITDPSMDFVRANVEIQNEPNVEQIPLANKQSVPNEVGIVEKLPVSGITSLTFSDNQSILGNVYPYFKVKGTPSRGIFIQGIGGLSQSLITPSNTLSNSFGIGFGYSFNKGTFILNAGANALVSNHNDLNLTRSAKVYGFGSDVYTYNLNYKQLYAVEGLIEAGWRMNRHDFKIGVRPSFVFSSRVRVNESELSDQAIVAVNENTDYYGYLDGLTRFGLKPTIGYAFHFTPSVEIGLNIGAQLRKMVKEDYVKGANNWLPIDGQIYLRKTINF